MRIVCSTSPWRSQQIGLSIPDATQTSSNTQDKNEMTTSKKPSATPSNWLSLAKPGFSLRVHLARKSLTPSGGMPFKPERQTLPTLCCSGKCVYQARGSHSLISDVGTTAPTGTWLTFSQTYKRTPIHFYDPHKAPLLDHYVSGSFERRGS